MTLKGISPPVFQYEFLSLWNVECASLFIYLLWEGQYKRFFFAKILPFSLSYKLPKRILYNYILLYLHFTLRVYDSVRQSKWNWNLFLTSNKYTHVKDAAYKTLHQLFLPSSPQYHLFLTSPKRDVLCTHIPSGWRAFNFLLDQVMSVTQYKSKFKIQFLESCAPGWSTITFYLMLPIMSLFFFYQSIIAIQCYVSFRCTT